MTSSWDTLYLSLGGKGLNTLLPITFIFYLHANFFTLHCHPVSLIFNILTSQFFPVYPSLQWHKNLLSRSTHCFVPSGLHGSLRHSSISASHCSPAKNRTFSSHSVTRVTPGRSCRIFLVKKIHSMPSFGAEVKPSVSCRRLAACKRTLVKYEEVRITGQIDLPFLARNSILRWLGSLMSTHNLQTSQQLQLHTTHTKNC
jgi:hypothetical protein